MIRLRITISGRVQNVFFRHTAQKIAGTLNLSGWVKNVDTDVVCEVQGEEVLVDQFVVFSLHGPQLAEVKSVLLEYIAVFPGEKGFQIIA